MPDPRSFNMKSKDTFFSSKPCINCGGRLLSFERPQVMGILNITPDSFYSDSRQMSAEHIREQAGKMIKEGAAILDVGAVSSRPGSKAIPESEELNRLCPALNNLRKHYPDALISVDTFRSAVARKVVKEYGVDIINDISGGQMDEAMFETVAELQVPYVLMHMKGTPENMQNNTQYDYLVQEMLLYFSEKINRLNRLGVNDIIIDPGFGFAKNSSQNFEILGSLDSFHILEKPLMVGVSRKSMIYKTLDISASDALNGSTALHAVALMCGANILRVHDVQEAVEVVRLLEMLLPCE